MDGTPKTPSNDDTGTGSDTETGSAGDNSNGDRQKLNTEPMTVDGIVAMFLNSTSATKASIIKEALIEINVRLRAKNSDVG